MAKPRVRLLCSAGAPRSLHPLTVQSTAERDKSAPIDALAAALRQPDLAVVRLDGEERELRLLVDQR